MNTAAKVISYLFHPLIMPIIGLLIIFNTDSYINYAVPEGLKQVVLILVGTSTFILPLLISVLLLNRKMINSLEMETQQERIIPYSFTIAFYIFALYMLNQLPIPPLIFKFIIGATLSLIIAFIVNIKWKISAHMIAIGGLSGAILCISILMGIYVTPYLLLSMLVAGLVGSARLVLKVHTPSQVYIGFAVGVICQVVVLYF
ncbi:MAG: phosphatase PAP2 family protein [Vicingaceae bacterium]|nr:phosphatase PAP2 family protein [Vicingaceae bacterium]